MNAYRFIAQNNLQKVETILLGYDRCSDSPQYFNLKTECVESTPTPKSVNLKELHLAFREYSELKEVTKEYNLRYQQWKRKVHDEDNLYNVIVPTETTINADTLDNFLSQDKFQDPNESWGILKKMYSTKRAYLSRQVTKNYIEDRPELLQWLVDIGFDVTYQPCGTNEQIRFKRGKHLGIIFSSGSGNLIAHEICKHFKGN